MSRIYIDKTAQVDDSVSIGEGTKIWANTQIRERVVIGKNVTIGRNVYVGPGVIVGDNVKIQNNALIYEPAKIEFGCFIGPGVILTNDKYPKAVNYDGSVRMEKDWDKAGVTVKKNASIGAGAVCIAPLIIGEGSMVGAGSIVTKDVPEGTLVIGNPARGQDKVRA